MVPYLLSVTGKAYNGDRLNGRWNRWRALPEAAPIAGLEMTIHGLRATAVVDRRLAGLTHQEIASQLGMSLKMVMRYSRFCDQEELAKAGMAPRRTLSELNWKMLIRRLENFVCKSLILRHM
jgi:hypothetical protein